LAQIADCHVGAVACLFWKKKIEKLSAASAAAAGACCRETICGGASVTGTHVSRVVAAWGPGAGTCQIETRFEEHVF
jgi:hypothetical protein